VITPEPATWPRCILCAEPIAPYFVSRHPMRLVAGSGFGLGGRSVWACYKHSPEDIAACKARIRAVDGSPVLQSEMEFSA
jgi:hypothetical protein